MQVKPPASRVAIPPPTKHRAVLGQLSDMDLRLLQVFKAVVECGGMSAAELELNIGTSTVSRHMKDLETRLGLTLCRRGRAGFALTAEGQRVYDETLRLLSAVEAFRSSIDDIHRRMGGRLERKMHVVIPQANEHGPLVIRLHKGDRFVNCHLTPGEGEFLIAQLAHFLLDAGQIVRR